jgi:hypothetical protein
MFPVEPCRGIAQGQHRDRQVIVGVLRVRAAERLGHAPGISQVMGYPELDHVAPLAV